jgi:hypothetical protein
MAITTLEFLNKNQFRRYPLKAEATQTSVDGDTFSTELVVACSVSTTKERRDLHISQIVVSGSTITLALSASTTAGLVCLGRFHGELIGDNTTLLLESFVSYASGSITLGAADLLLAMRNSYMLPPSAAPLEESTVFYYTPPRVRALTNRGDTLQGRVEFGLLTNVQKTTVENTIQLGTQVTLNLNSLADKSSHFNNCPTPVIRYVEGAVPFYDDSGNYPALQGNLYLVGIAPVVFYGGAGAGSISTQTITIDGSALTLDNLCTARNSVLPPINPIYLANLPNEQSENKTFVGKENYYTKSYYTPVNFVDAVEPEFLSWPQFFSNYTKIVPAGVSGNSAEIIKISSSKEGLPIRRVVIRNSGDAGLQVSLKKNGVVCDGYSNIAVGSYQAVTLNGAAPIPTAKDDIFEVYFDSVTGSPTALVQVVLFYR